MSTGSPYENFTPEIPENISQSRANDFAENFETQNSQEIGAEKIGDFLKNSGAEFLEEIEKKSPGAAAVLRGEKVGSKMIESAFGFLKSILSGIDFSKITAGKSGTEKPPTIENFSPQNLESLNLPPHAEFNPNAGNVRDKLENILRAANLPNFHPTFLQKTLENCFAESTPKYLFYEKTPAPFAEFAAILVQTGNSNLAQKAISELKNTQPKSFNFTQLLQNLDFQNSAEAQNLVAKNPDNFLYLHNFFGIYRDLKEQKKLRIKLAEKSGKNFKNL